MRNSITLSEARESVKNIDFGTLPTGWVIDMNKVAKAYKSYANKSSHETAVYFITYYIHRFKVQTYINVNCD